MKKPEKIYVSKDLFRWSFNQPTDKSDIEFIRKDLTNLDWFDIMEIRRIIDELEGSRISENMDSAEFNSEVARRFNKFNETRK